MENLSEKIKIPCVILAGGKSSRFGRDKGVLFAKHQFDYLSQFFEKVYISADRDKFDFEVELILDSSKIKAPIFALRDILKRFNEVFVVSVDSLEVKRDIIFNLVKNRAVSDKNPLVGYYDISILNKIEDRISNNIFKIYGLQKSLETDEIVNINYPNDKFF